jgi:DNA helicase II / ATP-dependent DNA helicase PcrA
LNDQRTIFETDDRTVGVADLVERWLTVWRHDARSNFGAFQSLPSPSFMNPPPSPRLQVSLNTLNPAQREAATAEAGPVLILAGAGTGKTRVLVHRVAYLVETERTQPERVFAVTFTNKAAQEMRHRLEALLGPAMQGAWIGTFHALASRLLRQFGDRLGYTRNFTIYDADDSKRTLKRILEEQGFAGRLSSGGVAVPSVAHEIDRAKNHGLSPKQFGTDEQPLDTPARRVARKVYPLYQQALAQANAMDFGDLLRCAVDLLKNHTDVWELMTDRFRSVFVDEFQDTNQVQYNFLKLLVKPHRNLTVVGDDDQAIYRWRGADVRNILEFAKTFPEAKVVKLEENYRSTANILHAANSVIRRNVNRHDKQLRTQAERGLPIRVAMFLRSEEEAGFVAQAIAERIDRGMPPSDVAVLYRQNAQSRLIEEALKRARIPYRLIGGLSFYQRMEVKDVLAYLRILANPRSSEDFSRILNTPARGIGTKTMERLAIVSSESGHLGREVLQLGGDALLRAGLGKAAVRKLLQLGVLLEDLENLAAHASPTEVVRAIIEKTDYLSYLQRQEPLSFEDRLQNIQELVSSIAEYEQRLQERAPLEDRSTTPLEAFLDEAALTTSESPADANSVSLMTLHGAKGLEYPTVFMVGLEEDTFPSRQATEGEEEALQEERRLCYVGMTRAMKELFLLGARIRRIYGREELRRPSRFLGELPDEVVAEQTSTLGDMDDVGAYRGRSAHIPAASDLSEIVYREENPQMIRPGCRVYHNTFGCGTVESSDGPGQDARLTIRFPEVGVKRVVARFVSSAPES